MGFAPVENPQIAIVVLIEHGKGSPAVARIVLDEYLKDYKHEQP